MSVHLGCVSVGPDLVFCVQAQTRDTASVITDVRGAAIPGASVTVASANTGQVRNVVSSTQREYQFNVLPVGGYSVSVRHASFRQDGHTGILLRANENAKEDVRLAVGDVDTKVQVVASAAQVETRSSTWKETVDSARVVELPLNGRNAADLALLVPGVISRAITWVIAAATSVRASKKSSPLMDPGITGITNPNFGQLTSTDAGPRILQLALKVIF